MPSNYLREQLFKTTQIRFQETEVTHLLSYISLDSFWVDPAGLSLLEPSGAVGREFRSNNLVIFLELLLSKNTSPTAISTLNKMKARRYRLALIMDRFASKVYLVHECTRTANKQMILNRENRIRCSCFFHHFKGVLPHSFLEEFLMDIEVHERGNFSNGSRQVA